MYLGFYIRVKEKRCQKCPITGTVTLLFLSALGFLHIYLSISFYIYLISIILCRFVNFIAVARVTTYRSATRTIPPLYTARLAVVNSVGGRCRLMSLISIQVSRIILSARKRRGREGGRGAERGKGRGREDSNG